MDREEIRYLLGSTIYARAKAYENRVQDLECETAENGVRHLSADVRGSGRNLYRTQAWLRQNGSFVSASCTCPFNENGEGPCCKHIGALLLHEVDEPEEKMEPKPEKKALLDIPGVQRGTEFAKEAAARKDSYVSGLEMLFGRKWRGDEPVSDVQAQELLRAYQEDALAEVERRFGRFLPHVKWPRWRGWRPRTASSEASRNWNRSSSWTTPDSRRCCASAFRTAGGSMS